MLGKDKTSQIRVFFFFNFYFQKTPFVAVFIHLAPPASYDYVLGQSV